MVSKEAEKEEADEKKVQVEVGVYATALNYQDDTTRIVPDGAG